MFILFFLLFMTKLDNRRHAARGLLALKATDRELMTQISPDQTFLSRGGMWAAAVYVASSCCDSIYKIKSSSEDSGME